MIGIILPRRKIQTYTQDQPKDQYIHFYTRLAQKNNVDVCFYAMSHIRMKDRTVEGLVYSHTEDHMAKQTVPIPTLNLYRVNASLSNKKHIKKYRQLSEKEGVVFFNACTRKERCKYKDYQHLHSIPELRPHLPETYTLTFEHLTNMLIRHNIVFIKRKQGGKGNHIYIIEQIQTGDNNKYKVTHVFKQKDRIQRMNFNQIKKFYNSFHDPSRFVVQQGIHLKKFEDKKFDVRVSPQKNKHGQWQITGMMARIALPGWNVTNLDQGGSAKYKIKKLINRETKEKIKKLSIFIAQAMEERFPNFIDLGIDFAVDEEENIWFLEANFRPFRKKVAVKRNRIPFEHVCYVYKRRQEEADQIHEGINQTNDESYAINEITNQVSEDFHAINEITNKVSEESHETTEENRDTKKESPDTYEM